MKSIIWTLAVVAGLLTLGGCSHLIIHDEDSTGMKTAKFSVRAALVPVTLFWSEVYMNRAKYNERIASSQAALDQRFIECRDAMSEEERRSACLTFEYERQKHEALLADYLQWRGNVARSARRMSAASSSQHCTSTVVGNTVQTHCY